MLVWLAKPVLIVIVLATAMCGPKPAPACCAIQLYDISRMGTVGDWVINPDQGQPLVSPDEWWQACRYDLVLTKALNSMGNQSTLLVTLVHYPGRYAGEWHLRPESRIDYATYGWSAVKAFGVFLYN